MEAEERELTKEEILLHKGKGIDFWYFLTEILGCKERKSVGWKDLVIEHEQLARFLQFDEHRFKLVLMPRFSLKSTIATVAWGLWNIVFNSNVRILIYSETAGKSMGFLGEIKGHIEGSGFGRFRDVYGDLRGGKDQKWNESEIVVSTRVINVKEPTVDTGGVETGKVGSHYDIMIFDDIVSDLNSTNKGQCDKVWDCYKRSLSLLKPDGQVLVVGTRWHFGDAYGRMIEENKGSNKWGIFIKAAREGNRYPFEQIGLSKEFLDGQRLSQGSMLFSCLYFNNPVDDSTALFKHDDFKFYPDRSIVGEELDGLFKTCVCDPAGEGEDYTAFTVIGTDDKMRMYLLYASNEHLKPSQIVDKILKLSYEFHFTKFGVETNTFNGMLEKELNLALQEERKNKYFRPFGIEVFRGTCKKGEGKHARIKALQPYHERGHLIFPCVGQKVESLRGPYLTLAEQMMQYTESHRPIHDDLLDSLAYHIQLIRPGDRAVEDKPGEDTFIGMLENQRIINNRLQKRLPLQYRKYQESFLDLK